MAAKKNTLTENLFEAFAKSVGDSIEPVQKKAIEELEKKYEVNISLGTLTYDEGEVRGKMIARKGDKKLVKATINEFKIGDIVTIDHKTVDPKRQYRVIKINKKTLKVINLNNKFNIVKVSPGLLVKVNPQLQSVIDKF